MKEDIFSNFISSEFLDLAKGLFEEFELHELDALIQSVANNPLEFIHKDQQLPEVLKKIETNKESDEEITPFPDTFGFERPILKLKRKSTNQLDKTSTLAVVD